MKPKRILAALQLLLIAPALLFMSALVLRQLSALQQEPASASHHIVIWYAGRTRTLWTLLITLPLMVLITGSVALLRSWSKAAELPDRGRTQALRMVHADGPTLFIALMTLTAGVILAIVALHMAVN